MGKLPKSNFKQRMIDALKTMRASVDGCAWITVDHRRQKLVPLATICDGWPTEGQNFAAYIAHRGRIHRAEIWWHEGRLHVDCSCGRFFRTNDDAVKAIIAEDHPREAPR